jgi:cytochrome c-type biogenesis protein CcmE
MTSFHLRSVFVAFVVLAQHGDNFLEKEIKSFYQQAK